MSMLTVLLYVLSVSVGSTVSWWHDHVSPLRYSVYDSEHVIQFAGEYSTTSSSELHRFRLLDSDQHTVLIGARSVVYNISLLNLAENVDQRINWRSNDADISMCQLKGLAEEDCHNYLRVARRHDDNTMYVCGTNAYKPQCLQFKQSKNGVYQTSGASVSGVGVCPFSPRDNSSFVVADGEIYSGTVADPVGSDSLIYRKPLRTEQAELKQLNAPQFVGSFDYGGYVYFFFRETAVEYMNCGKRVYSRVARVCKNDRGSGSKRSHWTSFMKARLNCSVPADYPFYFDEIQSISLVSTNTHSATGQYEDVLYAVFTTPVNSIAGSAVCAFRMSDIEAIFSGPVKHQSHINSNWLPLKPPQKVSLDQCVADSHTLSSDSVRFICSHPLLDRAVGAVSSGPLLVRASGTQYRLTHISVEHMINTQLDVIYLATDNGRILKTVVTGGENDPILLDEINLPALSPSAGVNNGVNIGPVTALLVSPSAGRLLLVSDSRLLSLPLAKCSSSSSCSRCVRLRDPHCAWHQTAGRCLFVAPPSGTLSNYQPLLQNITHGVHSQCTQDDDQQTNILYNEASSGSAVSQNKEDHLYTAVSSNKMTSHSRDEMPDISVAPSIGANSNYYSASSVTIAVITACLVSLLVGFCGGYFTAARCSNDVSSVCCIQSLCGAKHSSSSSSRHCTPSSSATKHLELQYKLKHLDQQHLHCTSPADLFKCDNRYDIGLCRNDASLPCSTSSAAAAKQINLLVNDTKLDLTSSSSSQPASLEKNVNSTFDNLPVQKVRKMYL